MSSKIKVTFDISDEKFKKPIQFGWKGKVVYSGNGSENAEVYYITPSGKKLRSKEEIRLYLEDGLDVNMFTFTKRPVGVDQEIVRIASQKGYMKPVNRTVGFNDSGLGELMAETRRNVIRSLIFCVYQ